MFSLFFSSCSIEFDHSAVERLGRSEVVNNVLVIGVVQQSELPQLGPGDLQRREEVDPLHHLQLIININ